MPGIRRIGCVATDSMSVAAFSDEPATPGSLPTRRKGTCEVGGCGVHSTGVQAACICTGTIAVHTQRAV